MTEQALVSDIKDCLFFKNDEDNPNAKGEELNLGLVEAKCSEFNISRKKIQIGGGGCILNCHIYYASSQISRSFYEIAKTSSISVLKNHIWLKRNEEKPYSCQIKPHFSTALPNPEYCRVPIRRIDWS